MKFVEEKLGVELISYKFNKNYHFCRGHIGTTNFTPYLNQLPKIDLVYAALPRPQTFDFWYGMVDRDKIAHDKFIEGLTEIFKKVDADEYHIEVGKTNRAQVESFFKQWGKFSYFYEREILYSAPLNGKSQGMAKCRNSMETLIYSMHPVEIPDGKYSHDYVDQLLKSKTEKLTCFDPVIGKGLLVRSALRHGHSCYGSEMNINRLKCVFEYVLKNLS